MLDRFRALVVAVSFSAVTLLGGVAQAQTCQPGIADAFSAHPTEYFVLLAVLAPTVPNLNTKLAAVVDQPTYASLLTDARTIAASLPTGRVLITLPDGTTVLDTARADDPNNNLPAGNSFAHFQAKTVNENHNSRIAIFVAQEYPCGFGLEAKFSTSTLQREFYAAARLGTHLDSNGTARLSVRQ